jgi:hypothetical protein
MSPLMLIIFAPVLIGGTAFAALLLGAATTGAWEAVAERPGERPSVHVPARPQVATQERSHARAA